MLTLPFEYFRNKSSVAVSADFSVETASHVHSELRLEGEAAVSKGPEPHLRPRLRALIIGAGTVGQTLAHNLEAGGRYEVVGFIDDDSHISSQENGLILGKRQDVMDIVQSYAVNEVFLAFAPTWQQLMAEKLVAECPHVEVRVVPTPYETLMRLRQVEHCGDIALVRMAATRKWPLEAAKRASDILMALCGLALSFPIALLAALLVKFTSSGPVLFRQERVGRFGKTFQMYKFRTMIYDAEAATGPIRSSGKGDRRLTSVGRWFRLCRVDEIPQLWNVLRGEMSMVGPRPERPVFVKKYQRQVPSYARRHLVRPGITGLAQVCSGYHTDARDKLRFDLIYVTHQSFWFDLSLLVRTILVVCLPKIKHFECGQSVTE